MSPRTDLTLISWCFFSCVLYGHCKEKQNNCVSDRSTVTVQHKIREIEWKSKTNFHYSVVISDPPCLNEHNKLMIRICFDGNWSTPEKSSCKTIEENTLCPSNFIQKDKLCVYKTQPRPWEEGCAYPGSLISFDKFAWLPIRRRLPFGPFEYAYPGEKYGSEFFEDDSSESKEYLGNDDANCAVSIFNGIQLTDCNSHFPHVCSYKYNHFLHRCPTDCMAAGLGSNLCYCKIKNVESLPRNRWCDQLAIARYSYERFILQKLAGNDICWARGLHQNSEKPDYSELNLRLAVNKNGWSLQEDKTLNCAICEVPAVIPPKVEMLLKISGRSGKMYVTVYSPEGLLQVDDEDSVYCFTDSTGKLKTRVDIDEIWDSDTDEHSTTQLKVYEVSIVGDGPGYYWCEAFQLPDVTLIKSNRILGHKGFKGHEYALRLRIHDYCRFLLFGKCKFPSLNGINVISKQLLFSERCLSKFVKSIRLYYVFDAGTSNDTIDILLHLSTEGKLPLIAEYFVLYRCLQQLRRKHYVYVKIIFFRSSEACLEEITTNNRVLHWKTTAIGKLSLPDEVCLQDNGRPIRRLCEGDFTFGAEWAEVDGKCSENVTLSPRTELLRSYLDLDLSLNFTKNISNITENVEDLTVLDLRLLAEVLSKTSAFCNSCSSDTLNDFIQIVSNLMRSNRTVLKDSQALLNVTDEILNTFENILVCLNMSTESFLIRKSNLIIHITKPFLSNYSGLALYRENAQVFDDLSDYKIKLLSADTNFSELLNENNLEVGAYVPKYLLNAIFHNMSSENKSQIRVITTVFSKDNFFNTDENETKTVAGRIVSVTIPGYGEFLKVPLPIVFKSQVNHSDEMQDCGFWNYGSSSETNTGHWSTVGGTYLGHLNNSSLETCYFSHLTNFALLVLTEPISLNDEDNLTHSIILEENHNKALTTLSNIGCILSGLGILGILITSLLFKSWREKVGTRILIQLCITILSQIVFLNLAANVVTYHSCIILGVFLHYVILAEFCWMLVAAILQFLRFVIVIGPIPNRLILKTMIIGWGLPLLPIIIVCLVDLDTYTSGSLGFCYPSSLSLYFGVLLPIAIIVGVNLGIFVAVIRNVFVLSVETHGKPQALLKRQICLAVLLFFLLGLPWIFGLLAEITSNHSVCSYIFLYLFCILATLQGFVLFIFYVLLDNYTRSLWYNLFRKLLTR